jgi:hypothetical protein
MASHRRRRAFNAAGALAAAGVVLAAGAVFVETF